MTSLQSDRPSSENQKVTAIISHFVRPGREEGYEEWLKGIGAAAQEFEGHDGVTVIKPKPGGHNEYVAILRFNTYPQLCRWLKSDQRKKWIDCVKPLIQESEKVQIITGLENLVSLPGSVSVTAPPRYKTAIIVWLGVFLCSSVLGIVLNPLLAALPLFLPQLISIGITVFVLTYFVMPLLTRLFYKWLHPQSK
ncbi:MULTISPECIES: hypothetical protein [Spirulina sp. CCY15215]|uniref:hypothetical protein n=1 Tax=Spirulina sp. CCY15215 TaxID=2767591 RepID=UPI00194EFBBB|nr:hypothetical protein [Spirulina major]